MAWEEGRRLVTANGGGKTLSFTYDSDGLRLSKNVGSTTYSYLYAGGKLIRQTGGGNTLDFFYDESGHPYALTYNGTTYYYVTNLQGDVLEILDGNKQVVASYTYDPYGKVLSAAGTLAEVNPLRYRGYVYDSETGFYYLQSRYYDPAIGRFINADSYVSTGQGFLGHNMFAYCLNNPIIFKDKSGNNAEAVQLWTSAMWWLCGADTVLPVGDIIYIAGILLFGAIALSGDQEYVPEVSYDEADVAPGPPSPNNDDDDDDDDYYEDDSNFAGRQKVGKSKGNTPGNNQAQNKQFKDAAKGFTPEQQRIVHDKITGKGMGFHEIEALFNELFGPSKR